MVADCAQWPRLFGAETRPTSGWPRWATRSRPIGYYVCLLFGPASGVTSAVGEQTGASVAAFDAFGVASVAQQTTLIQIVSRQTSGPDEELWSD